MLTSFALIILTGLLLGWISDRLKLPRLVGMIAAGILLGPYVLNLLDTTILELSADLRQTALIIILTRAGLSLDLNDLKRVGRPAVLMCFVPACFEIAGTIFLAPLLLGCSLLDAAITGAVIAAVSPAVIVPRMIRLIENGYGKSHSIPQLILAGASVDDVIVIVIFTALTSLSCGGHIALTDFLQIPVSICSGIAAGYLAGTLLILFFRRFHMRDSVKLLILLSICFLFLELETRLKPVFQFSGLLAIMTVGLLLKWKYDVLAGRLSSKYNKLWVAAELLLFVLVGAAVNVNYAMKLGVVAIILVLLALSVRMIGVALCTVRTQLSFRERIFCMISYTPKATVQAAIGGVPLAMGLSCGEQVLTVAVVSILVTAPLGAFCIDHFYKKLLTCDE